MKKDEIEIMMLLERCWNKFIELESQHPNETKDFADGIHKCQYVMAMRTARQYEPGIFKTIKKEKNNEKM